MWLLACRTWSVGWRYVGPPANPARADPLKNFVGRGGVTLSPCHLFSNSEKAGLAARRVPDVALLVQSVWQFVGKQSASPEPPRPFGLCKRSAVAAPARCVRRPIIQSICNGRAAGRVLLWWLSWGVVRAPRAFRDRIGCPDWPAALGPHVGRLVRGQIFPGAGAVLRTLDSQ